MSWSEKRTFLTVAEVLRPLCSRGNASCGLLAPFFSIPTSFGGGGGAAAWGTLSAVEGVVCAGIPMTCLEGAGACVVGGHTDTTLEESLPSSSAVSTTKQGTV